MNYRRDIDLVSHYFKKKFEEMKRQNQKLTEDHIYTKNIKIGKKFTIDNIKRVRPVMYRAKIFQSIIRKKSPINISVNEPIKKNILKKLKIFKF